MNEHAKRLRRSDHHLVQLVLIAMFAALSYVAVMLIHIPYPAPVGKPFIHFGNLVTILAGLLLGGWQGGLSGSIGMGLYDITMGYGFESIKTIVLKFGIGLFAGWLARYGRRHPEKNPRLGLGIAAGISLVLGGGIWLGKQLHWAFLERAAALSYILLLAIGVLLAALTIAASCTRRLSNTLLFAVLGAAAGIAWNVVGEFAGGTILALLSGSALPAAMLASLTSLPATFINGTVSIAGASLLYMPLRAALTSARLGDLLD